MRPGLKSNWFSRAGYRAVCIGPFCAMICCGATSALAQERHRGTIRSVDGKVVARTGTDVLGRLIVRDRNGYVRYRVEPDVLGRQQIRSPDGKRVGKLDAEGRPPLRNN